MTILLLRMSRAKASSTDTEVWRRLQLSQTPAVLVTASADRLVRVWSRKGVHLGTLRAQPGADKRWNFDDEEAAADASAKMLRRMEQESFKRSQAALENADRRYSVASRRSGKIKRTFHLKTAILMSIK